MFLDKGLRIDISPIKISKLNFAGRTTELKMSLKHLGVMQDGNIYWEPHINIFKKENRKIIWLL